MRGPRGKNLKYSKTNISKAVTSTPNSRFLDLTVLIDVAYVPNSANVYVLYVTHMPSTWLHNFLNMGVLHAPQSTRIGSLSEYFASPCSLRGNVEGWSMNIHRKYFCSHVYLACQEKGRIRLSFLPRPWPLWGPCNASASPRVFEDGWLLSVSVQGVCCYFSYSTVGTWSGSYAKSL